MAVASGYSPVVIWIFGSNKNEKVADNWARGVGRVAILFKAKWPRLLHGSTLIYRTVLTETVSEGFCTRS